MILAYSRVKEFIPQLNMKALTEHDFWEIVADFDVDIAELDLSAEGYYVRDKSGDYVFINRKLRNPVWLVVAFHEFFHFLLHVPGACELRRSQIEAESLALIAVFPQTELPCLVRGFEDFDRDTQKLIEKRIIVLQDTTL